MQVPQPSARNFFAACLPVIALFIVSMVLIGSMVLLMTTVPPAWGAAFTQELSGSPTNTAFGHIPVGETRTVEVSFTNKSTRKIKISKIDSSDSRFQLSKLDLPKTLAAGEKLKATVTFAPSIKGWVGGRITVTSDASNQTVALAVEGTGEAAAKPELTITPATLRFGNVAVGSHETLTVGLNAKNGSVKITSVSSSNSQFEVLDAKLPLTIAEGKESSIDVRFKPQADGQKQAKLSFVSDASNSPAPESLAGIGTAPYVTLSWIASTSEVTGYNIYRSSSDSGTYAKLNSKVDPDTSYSDKTIVDGKTYYYKTKAVASDGKESSFSEVVEVEIP
ncbi:MAG: choice-of-anchor D domain-containing protein [Candidatus Sulfotelmatobacter sp.]|jgi:hypothetical protein